MQRVDSSYLLGPAYSTDHHILTFIAFLSYRRNAILCPIVIQTTIWAVRYEQSYIRQGSVVPSGLWYVSTVTRRRLPHNGPMDSIKCPSPFIEGYVSSPLETLTVENLERRHGRSDKEKRKTHCLSNSRRILTWSIFPSILPSRMRSISSFSTSFASTFNCFRI